MKILVKNRSGHDMSHMGPYLKSFLPYAQKRMGFNRPPTIFFDSDPQNAENVLGKTAYYNPETEEIVVFVDKRHPKDILRSLSHELVHHSQNCRGDLNPEIAGETTPGYAQTNAHMRAMEGEAYLKGNGYYFRDWEDSLKNGLEETNYKHITGDTHKMATYDQLKEEITAKVVATLTEKLKGKQHKIDADKDGEITAKDFELLRKDESVEEVNEEEEIEERKKRDTPRDSDRREPQKLKINEEEQLEEMHCGGKRHDDLEAGMRCPMCGHVVMAEAEDEDKKETPEELRRKAAREAAMHYTQHDSGKYGSKREGKEEELEEYGSAGYGAYLSGYDSEEEMRAAQARSEKAKRKREEEERRKAAFNSARFQRENEELEEAQKKEVVEETISNDEWYQNELFESLKKRWTK